MLLENSIHIAPGHFVKDGGSQRDHRHKHSYDEISILRKLARRAPCDKPVNVAFPELSKS